jgi:penicillin-binding protein 1A
VIQPADVAAMNNMLTATIQYGTGNVGSIDPHPAAGKTGTGQNYRDAWFIGYTAHYVTGVWLGNDDFTPMKRVTGGSLPTLIWRDLMIYAHVNKQPAFLPGGEQLQAGNRAPPSSGGSGGSLFDTLFGEDRRVARDTTLGTPAAGTATRGSGRKSWLEELFSN